MKLMNYKTAIYAGTFVAYLFSSSGISMAEVAPAGKYQIDPTHTSVQFKVSHLGFSYLIGRFNTLEGDINLNPKGKSDVTLTIKADSIDSNHAKRDEHLRSPDFFNVKQFPEIKFVSDKIEFNAMGEPVKITGKLSLHGKTEVVTLNVKAVGAGKDPWGGYRSGYDATTTIKRSAFGMNFMPGGIGDDIDITINLEAIKK